MVGTLTKGLLPWHRVGGWRHLVDFACGILKLGHCALNPILR